MELVYVSHAKNVEELRMEVVSDLKRRLDMLSSWRDVMAKSEREKARYGIAINELNNAIKFWSEVQIQPQGKAKGEVRAGAKLASEAPPEAPE